MLSFSLSPRPLRYPPSFFFHSCFCHRRALHFYIFAAKVLPAICPPTTPPCSSCACPRHSPPQVAEFFCASIFFYFLLFLLLRGLLQRQLQLQLVSLSFVAVVSAHVLGVSSFSFTLCITFFFFFVFLLVPHFYFRRLFVLVVFALVLLYVSTATSVFVCVCACVWVSWSFRLGAYFVSLYVFGDIFFCSSAYKCMSVCGAPFFLARPFRLEKLLLRGLQIGNAKELSLWKTGGIRKLFVRLDVVQRSVPKTKWKNKFCFAKLAHCCCDCPRIWVLVQTFLTT